MRASRSSHPAGICWRSTSSSPKQQKQGQGACRPHSNSRWAYLSSWCHSLTPSRIIASTGRVTRDDATMRFTKSRQESTKCEGHICIASLASPAPAARGAATLLSIRITRSVIFRFQDLWMRLPRRQLHPSIHHTTMLLSHSLCRRALLSTSSDSTTRCLSSLQDAGANPKKSLVTTEEGVHQTMKVSKSWRNKPLFRRQGDVRFKTASRPRNSW